MFDTLREVPPAPPEDVPVEQILADYDRIVEALDAGAPVGALPPPWESEPEPPPWSACAPSGWLALELDQGTAVPGALSDADLIEGIIAFDRTVSWAGARQAELLAEFARRRPEVMGSPPTRSDVPARHSGYTPDEIALALHLSRTTAANRLVMAEVVVADLPATLAAWQAGTIDTLKARAITEASYLLPQEQRAALEERVLPRAGEQTVSRLRAALARAVLALDPDGVAERHEQRRKDRRVVLSPEGDGMANLWALLSAPDATAAYQRLCQLARDLGAEDPRSMDARRADLLTDLLTGRRCAATATVLDHDDCDHPDGPEGCDCTPTEHAPAEHTPTGPTEHTPTTSADPADPYAPDQQTPEPETSDQETPERETPEQETPEQDGAGRGEHDCPTTRGGGAGPGKPLISVVVPITTLMGLDEQPGELVGFGPIPAPLAREIAAEGTWRRLLTDPASGTLLDYGRTTYTPPAGLADFVRARDLYCRNPICGQRAATADLDHTIPWDGGGTTSEHNLYAACRHDHLMKTHAPGWHVDQYPDGRITWTTPTGHTYTSHPHNYRPNPPPDTGTPETGTPAGHDPPQDDEPPF
ncbi:MAG: DUF222 domain-containing protein [Pseudonocardiales bacterium]